MCRSSDGRACQETDSAAKCSEGPEHQRLCTILRTDAIQDLLRVPTFGFVPQKHVRNVEHVQVWKSKLWATAILLLLLLLLLLRLLLFALALAVVVAGAGGGAAAAGGFGCGSC